MPPVLGPVRTDDLPAFRAELQVTWKCHRSGLKPQGEQRLARDGNQLASREEPKELRWALLEGDDRDGRIRLISAGDQADSHVAHQVPGGRRAVGGERALGAQAIEGCECAT